MLATAEWLRIAITQFLSGESPTLMGGFQSVGEFKVYFIERFKSSGHVLRYARMDSK